MLGGFIKPTHLADFLKQQPSIVNLSTNPSSELSNGTVEVRRNLAVDPRASSGSSASGSNIGWRQQWFGDAGYAGITSVKTGVTPFSSNGTYLNKTWTASIANNTSNIGFQFTEGVGAGTTQRAAVTAGSLYSASCYVRASFASLAYFQFVISNSAGEQITIISGNTTTLSTSWVRPAHTFTMPAGAAYMSIRLVVGTSNPNVGDTIDGTGLLVEKDSGLLPYFDGTFNEWQAPDLTPSWTGTPNNSASILTGVRPAGITSYDLPIWLSTDNPLKGSKFARALIQTASTDVRIRDTTGVAAGENITAMLNVRANRSLNMMPQWNDSGGGWLAQATPSVAIGTGWTAVTRNRTTTTTNEGLGFNVGASVGDIIDVDTHFVVKGDYKGGWFDGTFNFSDASRTTMDNWRAWLRSQGATGFNTHDLETQWLKGQGYTGTFADMFYAKFGSKDGAREYFKNGGFFTDFAKTTFLSKTMTDNKLRNLVLYGLSTQAGTPTPDVPVPIVSTTGNVTVRSDSKNLIISDRISYTSNGLTITQNGNGSFTVNGTATAETYVHFSSTGARYIKIESGRTYTISNDTLGSVSTYSIDFNILFDDATNSVYSSRIAPTFTAPKNGITNAYLTVRSGYVATNLVIRPQLEVGSVATAFEKNTTSTQTLPLSTTQLRSLPNGVSDRIYKDGSTWKLEQNLGVRVLNGVENYTLNNIYATNVQFTSITGVPSVSGQTGIISSHLKTQAGDDIVNSIWIYGTSTLVINLDINIASTVAAFRTWLASNNITIQYTLATPITTTITDPTLITALENIRTYQGVTNITAGTPISGQYPRL